MHLRSSKPGSRFSFRELLTKDTLRLGGAAAVLLGTSCSVLYDLSPDQCGNNKECARFGSGFTCEEGICVDTRPQGGRPSGGRGGSAGTGDEGGTGGSEDTGGTMSGGSSGTGGSVDVGGSAGMGPTEECATHKDCFALNGDAEPWACVEGECQALTTEQCPVALPLDESLLYGVLKDPEVNALIIGAFWASDSVDNGAIQNYDLALTEINRETGGLPIGGSRRPVVAVACKARYATQEELLVPADHLITDLKVPAILAAVDVENQQYLFERRTRDANVFMIVPLSSDDSVVNLVDNGLIYHMLAGPDSMAVTYQPLLDLTIEHLRNQGKLGADEVPRIAAVTAEDHRFLADLGRNFQETVEWGGVSAADHLSSEPPLFVPVSTRTYDAEFEQGPVADAVLGLAPHIVVGATGAEMTTKIIQLIEAQWAEDGRELQDPPFYMLSPLNYGGVRNALLTNHPSVGERLLGIAWPAYLDSPAYKSYKSAYISAYPGGDKYDFENYYDAVYFLLYGIVAGGQPIRGDNIAAGMRRVANPAGQRFEVGKRNLTNGLNFLAASATSTTNLIGANGAPNWNAGGGRETPGSVWCIGRGEGSNPYPFVPDVLTYDPESAMLTGEFPASCFAFPEPEPMP